MKPQTVLTFTKTFVVASVALLTLVSCGRLDLRPSGETVFGHRNVDGSSCAVLNPTNTPSIARVQKITIPDPARTEYLLVFDLIDGGQSIGSVSTLQYGASDESVSKTVGSSTYYVQPSCQTSTCDEVTVLVSRVSGGSVVQNAFLIREYGYKFAVAWDSYNTSFNGPNEAYGVLVNELNACANK